MNPHFTAHGKQLLRDGEHFADAGSTDIAEALALILNGQILMGPDVPGEKQDWVAEVIWG